jgi:adenosylhomocysteine nucleosidase
MAVYGWNTECLVSEDVEIIVIISADIEWQAVRNLVPGAQIEISPFGEFFRKSIKSGNQQHHLILIHGGWGKISAAASCQYAIDRWRPKLLVNLGTCGGFEGEIEAGTIVLVERTIIYDIFEQMGDTEAHIAHYTTELDLSWLREPYPQEVQKSLLVSGDRDLHPGDINGLKRRFGAIAGDWESGAIAYVAQRNEVPCLILRGVSDIVSEKGGEAYQNISLYEESAKNILSNLMQTLPAWIERADVFMN